MSRLIAVRFPLRPRPEDLLFLSLPHVPWMQYVTDLVLLLAVGLLGVYAFSGHNTERIPSFICMFGLMELLRALIMALTPLASAAGNGRFFGLVPAVQNGMFPSGHVATVALCFLIVDRAIRPELKNVLGLLIIAESASMLLSHGHYSIDIVGGLLLSYFVFHEYEHGTAFAWLRAVVEPQR